MKKSLIIGIVFIVIIVIAAFVYYQEKSNNLINNQNMPKSTVNKGSDVPIDNPKNEFPDNFPLQINDSTGGSISGGGNPATPGTTEEEKQIPSDLNSQPCGFYFQDYGPEACGGVCPEGACVTQGNSCYCKI